MSFVVLRHGKNRYHRYAAVFALLTSRSLIKRCKVGVHIAGVSASARNLLARRRNLSQCIRVVRYIRQYYKNVHTLLKSKVFRSGQSHTRRCDTLNRGVVCKIDKHYRSVNRARFAEAVYKILRFLKRDSDSRKHNRKRLVCAAHLRLTCNLSRQSCVRKSARGENRQFLTSYKSVQTVYSRHARLYELLRIVARRGVHRQAVYVKPLFRKDFRTAVNRTSKPVKYSALHIVRYAKLH